jgi:hypothetical protein
MIACFIFYSSGLSQNTYKIDRYVFASGGVMGAVSPGYKLSATVGQCMVDTLLRGGAYRIHAGFWSPPVIVVGIPDVEDLLIPTVYALAQNYPNPFNPSTIIEYSVPIASEVSLEIYNILGQRVKVLVNSEQVAGYYEVSWDGRNETGSTVGSGMYIYRMVARSRQGESFVQTRKMLYMR